MTTRELIAFLGYARGSAGEVRSMILVVINRPKLRPVIGALTEISTTADSCIRQLAAWTTQIESGPVQGKRHLTADQKNARQAAAAKTDLRHQFLISLPSDHPLYNTPEAATAREKERPN